MKASPIPDLARALVKARARLHCERCGMSAVRGHWHHRRSRAVRDTHTHCPCNGVWLCGTCHGWVHAHPFDARSGGWIVSRYEPRPGVQPYQTPLGWLSPACAGTATFTD